MTHCNLVLAGACRTCGWAGDVGGAARLHGRRESTNFHPKDWNKCVTHCNLVLAGTLNG